jgi:hypothetical protein
MLHSVTELRKCPVLATDGTIGSIKDLHAIGIATAMEVTVSLNRHAIRYAPAYNG